jgi:hypothetical protein
MTVESSGDPKVDAEVWAKSVQEAKEEHLHGPFYKQAEITRFPGTASWIPNRRFGLKQGGTKIRRIDDLSGENVNFGYTTSNKLDLMGVEEVVSIAKVVANCISEDGTVSIELSNKEKLQGKLHHSLSRKEAADWVGKTVDLSNAYKQMMWRESSRRFAVLCVWNAEVKKAAYFISYTMNFGAIASVYAFNRAARSIWWIGTTLLKLVWTSYVDDYPVMSLAKLADNTESTMKIFLSLIGWAVDWGSAKDVKFSNLFTALGVQIDLRGIANHLVQVSNKQSRVEALQQVIGEVLRAGTLMPEMAAELAGKFQYAEGQTFGRMAKPALSVLYQAATRKKAGPLTSEQTRALKWLAVDVATAAPRRVDTIGETRPILFFTDGAAEDSEQRVHQYTTCGALIIDTATNEQWYFGLEIAKEIVALWSKGGKKQVIAQAELYPIIVSRMALQAKLTNRRCFFFIDNDSARDNLIGAFSKIASSMHLIYEFLRLDFVSPIHAWFARVQSVSNAGDDPSRLEFAQVARDWPQAKWLDTAAVCKRLDSELTRAERTDRTMANETIR